MINLSKWKLFAMLAIATIVCNACNEDDVTPANATEVCTFVSDSACFCLANPTDDQCKKLAATCTFENDSVCFCLANPSDDKCQVKVEVCEFETKPRCFCAENQDDARCKQSFGDTVFYDGFESFTAATLFQGDLEHSDDEFEKYGSLNGGTDDGVQAVQGQNYLSFIVDAYNSREEGDDEEGIFSVNDKKVPRIDLSDADKYTDPHINIWVNTGSKATNVADIDFELKFSGGDRERFFTYDFNEEADQQEASLISVTTKGEWELFSIKISQPIWHQDIDEQKPAPVDIWKLKDSADRTFERLRVHLRLNENNTKLAPTDPANAAFVAHVDGLSISEGPLVDVRPAE